jgi:probable nicotinate-nucleotide adenylyltransferase
MKIGLLLGSFDPIHIGHFNAAISVINDGLVDKVYFVPTPQNPWKTKKPVDLNLRCSMIREMINRFQEFSRMEVHVGYSDEELKETSRTFYSYDQLSKIVKDSTDEFYIIAGSDVIPDINGWYKGNEILKMFKTIEIDRVGKGEGPSIRVSSSDIRSMIASGKNPCPWVIPEIYRFIQVYDLYRI